MSAYKKISILVFVFINAFMLHSCISIDRKLKINANGSGDEILTITFHKQFYDAMASMSTFMDSSRRQGFLDSLYSDEIFESKTKNAYDTIPGIHFIELTSRTNEDSSKSFFIKYEFDSISKIGSSLAQLKDSLDKSETKVEWIKDGDNIKFRYFYEWPIAKESQANDSLMEQMRKGMAEMFGSGSATFEIQFPFEIISSNATSAEGNTLKWTFNMSDVIVSGKMNLEAVLKEN